MTTLSNGIIKVTVDGQAKLVSYENLTLGYGNIIEKPDPIYNCVFKNGDNWEEVARAENAKIRSWVEGNTMYVEASELGIKKGTLDVTILMTLTLEGEKIRFGATVENRSEATLVDFYYPAIGAVKSLAGGKQGLLYPVLYGHFFKDINAHISSISGWDGDSVMQDTYPYGLSMQWMSLIDGDTCLYFASYDDEFYATTLRAASHDGQPHCTLEFDKMAFVEPGEKWKCPEFVAWLYNGPWQRGAEEYSAWAKTWRHPIEPTQWIKDSNGFFLVIMKQQFGVEMWDYNQIPELYRMALDNGCDNLGLFGWFHTGHDNNYPDLEVSPTMGGEKALREGIAEVQRAGGHVTLYHQGHLMDLSSDFYKKTGERIAGKSRWGTPYFEPYSKFSQSDFLRQFSSKFFATVCPWCKEWHDLMGEKAEWIRSFGADAILYDQIGGIPPKPCFDKSHGHKKPSLSYSQGRLKMLPAIREHIDSHENYAFMSETITDVYSQFLDCVHGIGSWGCNHSDRHDFHRDGSNTVWNTPEMFLHTFPEQISTLRNPRPYIMPALANYALTYGFRLELEIRYETDIKAYNNDLHPDWREYTRRIFDLRKKYASLLLHGNYSCDSEIEKANPELCHGVFTNGEQKCVVLFNDCGEELPYTLPNLNPTHCAVSGVEQTEIPAAIGPDSTIVFFFD